MPVTTLNRDDELLTERDAATFLKLSARTLQNYRVAGGGPTFVRLGLRRVGFLKSDLLAFAAQRRFTSTSEEDARNAGTPSSVKG
jgi:predicted DNA-binding transcriptional regulator AlpA